MKKIIYFLLLFFIISCKGARWRHLKFTNKSSETVFIGIANGVGCSGNHTVKKNDSVILCKRTDEMSVTSFPFGVTGVIITLKNGKKILESCFSGNDGTRNPDCGIAPRSFFNNKAYKNYSGIGKNGGGVEYIFTDEDAARAK
jgi:hypothetical protein